MTWGSAYQFRGKDGSDANVPNYVNINGLDFTSITNSYIKSPRIFTSWLSVMPINFSGSLSDTITYNGITFKQGMRMFGNFGGNPNYEYFNVGTLDTGMSPSVCFFSNEGANAEWLFYKTTFMGDKVIFDTDVEFKGDVKGVTAVFG